MVTERFLRVLAAAAVLFVAGCTAPSGDPAPADDPADDAAAPPGQTTWVHVGDPDSFDAIAGNVTAPPDLVLPELSMHYVGFNGPEPTLGVTTNGYIFFVASTTVVRSIDNGTTWDVVSTDVSSPATLDPMLWVDTDTNRVFSDQLYLGCSYLSFSDDYGESWISNPAACGKPVNDHQKLATGVYTDASPLAPRTGENPIYPNVVYYAYNALTGGRVDVSTDGGLTFPQYGITFMNDCGGGGLHGHITAGPDGTVYVPARNCEERGPIVARSFDNGLNWQQQTVHDEIGTALCHKNPEVAVDVENNVYLTWPGKYHGLHMSYSTEHGIDWSDAMNASIPEIKTTTMPVIQAGDPGRVAMAYYGTTWGDQNPPDQVPNGSLWHLYYTYSINAMDENPTFVTVQVTPDDDPIQVGPISTNTGCGNPPGSRNLLDFIDMVIDQDGRPYIAYGDGCTDECDLTDMNTSRDADGMVAIVQTGPSLFEDMGELSKLPGVRPGTS